MRISSSLALAVVVAAGCFGVMALVRPVPATMPAQSAAAISIGVIDVEKVFNSLNERTDLQQQLQTYLTGLSEELKKLQEESKRAADNARQLPDGPEKNAAVQKAIELEATVRARSQVFDALADRRTADLFRSLYVKIQNGAKKLAEARGLTMVIATDENVQIPAGAGAQDTQRAIALKRIMYAAPSQDLSADLISMLNSEYRK
jgi:Skp family chaperone for outer membrane proteins